MKTNRIFLLLLILFSCILCNGCANEKGALEPEDHVTPSSTITESEKPEETDSPDNVTIDIHTSKEDYKDDDGEILLSFSGASASVEIKDNIALQQI
jgi:predicted small lipoprotein YifL